MALDVRPPAPLPPEELSRVVALWSGDGAAARRLDRSDQHLLYCFDGADGELVLRLTRPSHRDRRHVEEELAWIRYLDAHGLPVCRPAASVHGRWVEEVDHPADGRCVAVALERVRGTPVSVGAGGAWGAEVFAEWGRTAARIHALSAHYRPASGYRRRVLDGDALSEHAAGALPPEERWVADLVRTTWQGLRELPADASSYGMIHGDLSLGNLALDDGRLVVFDFYDCGHAWYCYDVAIILYITFFVLSRGDGYRRRARDFFAHFIGGYEQVKRLDTFWIATLPRFLCLFNTLAYIALSGRKVDPEDRELRRFAAAHLGSDELFADLDLWRSNAGSGPEG